MSTTNGDIGVRLHIAPEAQVPQWLLNRCEGLLEIIVVDGLRIIEIRGASAEFGFNSRTGHKDLLIKLPGLSGNWYCGFMADAVIQISDLEGRILERNEFFLTPTPALKIQTQKGGDEP